MHRFLLAIVLVSPAFGETNLAQAASKIWAAPLVLPAESTLISIEPGSDDERFVYTIRRTFSADGFVEEWTSNHATTTLAFTPDGKLVEDRHKNLFRQTGIEVKVAAGRASVHTVFTDKGKIKSDHTAGLNPGIFLREELDHLVVQAWRAGIRDKITAQVPRPEGDLMGDCSIVFRTVSDPTSVSSAYRYPAEFRAAFAKGPYVVADMGLTGFASVFFPHHFYLVYKAKGDGLEWVGYFGEDPKLPVFQFTPKQE